jgi:hypothetical protein
MSSLSRRFDPRRSSLPAAVGFLFGLGGHVLDQALYVRAGPVPILVTAPLVAVLTYVHLLPKTGLRRIGLLLVWGFVGSGIALLGVVFHALTSELPRAMTEMEMILYDLGLFLWFVLTLTASHALAARVNERPRYAAAALLAGPLLQVGWVLIVIALIESGAYA